MAGRTDRHVALAGLVALVTLGPACAATWDGLQRDTAGLFGSKDSDVAETQRLLNARGYDAGAADGALGPRTTRAIRDYQADHGLPVTGAIDDALLASLRTSRAKRPPRPEPVPRRAEEDWVDPY